MICSSRRRASCERWSSSTLGTLLLHRFVLGTAPSSGTLQAAAAGSRPAYRSPIPELCVSYFTHSRQFFELNDGVRADLEGQFSRRSRPRRSSSQGSNCCSDDGRLRSCGNFKSISRDAGTSFIGFTLCTKERVAKRGTTGTRTFVVANSVSSSGEERAVRSYRITLRDRQTQTVVGYYDGSWTTDRRRALGLRKREVAEAHAACMRERCPRNADLIKVERLDAAD